MHAAIDQIRSHDTHKLLSAKAAFLRLSPDEKARFARFFEAEAPTAEEPRSCGALRRFKFLGSFSAALSARPLVFFHRNSLSRRPPRVRAIAEERYCGASTEKNRDARSLAAAAAVKFITWL